MTRGTTWKGVEYLVVTKVQIRIALQYTTRPHPYHSVKDFPMKFGT